MRSPPCLIMLSVCIRPKFFCFSFVWVAGPCCYHWLEEVVNKASTILKIDNPILLEISITIKTRQANQILALPLANYTPYVISFGCKNRRVNISYRRTFHINRREFIFF